MNPTETTKSNVPRDPQFATRVQQSFARQTAMTTLGISLRRVEPGIVELRMPHSDRLTQQHGFVHAGILATALDSACGYAAMSLMENDSGVLTVEFKINLLAPAKGTEFVFTGSVVRSGRTLSVCEGQAFACSKNGEKLIASMSATMMAITGRSDVQG